jgi:hypothetical protein
MATVNIDTDKTPARDLPTKVQDTAPVTKTYELSEFDLE